ncbi:hypothetical protein J45TS6_47390 [Paenibacillus sp. J45TS6]|uniref:Uncharacterized protein n=1 Tax=Paenibacillus gallinarum TaxID=2762232 RepID=A0ABR8T6F3_9BACL|nr:MULTISPECIES: hypothetical protein [Paenibacillus]MBD7971348.1 hypothetical protein [Paenibacillus gallinarum]GIP46280.1 hypothetical protein J45TS6_47390 [Paenibacillus sp. J45TS6]
MLLSQVEKKTIESLHTGESYTFGGVTTGKNKRYEVQKVSDVEYKVAVYDLLIRLDADYVKTPKEVIDFIETN